MLGQLWNSIFKLLLFQVLIAKEAVSMLYVPESRICLSIIKRVLMISVVTFAKWASTIEELKASRFLNPYSKFWNTIRKYSSWFILFSHTPRNVLSCKQSLSLISKESAVALFSWLFKTSRFVFMQYSNPFSLFLDIYESIISKLSTIQRHPLLWTNPSFPHKSESKASTEWKYHICSSQHR